MANIRGVYNKSNEICYNEFNMYKINKKQIIFIVLGIVLIAFISLMLIYRKPIQTYFMNMRRQAEVSNIIKSFYVNYMEAVSTNVGWVNLIETYTEGRTKRLLTARANVFLQDAKEARQHLTEIVSPIKIRFYESNPNQVKVLVDFEFEGGLAGDPPRIENLSQLLVLEKINNRWMIVEDMSRSDRFNEWADAQNFATININL